MLAIPISVILGILVYTGQLDKQVVKGHAVDIVMKLMDRKLNSGHPLVVDDFTEAMIWHLLEKKWEYNETVHQLSIDF
jgi:hypothetical protein